MKMNYTIALTCAFILAVLQILQRFLSGAARVTEEVA